MPNIWPAGLPQKQLAGLSETGKTNVVEFQTDAGPFKRRRISTKRKIVQRTLMELTGAQKVIFDAFYADTLGGGVESFEWSDFLLDTTVEFRFVSEPVWTQTVPAASADGRLYEGTLELEKL